MGRPLRVAPGDTVYHVLNRANARMTLFEEDGDYLAFQRVLEAGKRCQEPFSGLRKGKRFQEPFGEAELSRKCIFNHAANLSF